MNEGQVGVIIEEIRDMFKALVEGQRIIQQDLASIKQDFASIEQDFASIEQDLTILEQCLDNIEQYATN